MAKTGAKRRSRKSGQGNRVFMAKPQTVLLKCIAFQLIKALSQIAISDRSMLNVNTYDAILTIAQHNQVDFSLAYNHATFLSAPVLS